MERTLNCCTVASLAALAILVLFPVRSWCEEETYNSLTECCGDAESKRFDDIDYDSFVGLMGRRSAAQPNRQRNTSPRKRHMDHILAALLKRRTRMACPCTEKYSQKGRGRLISHVRQRFQRFL